MHVTAEAAAQLTSGTAMQRVVRPKEAALHAEEPRQSLMRTSDKDRGDAA